MKEQNSLANIMLDIQAIEETQQGQLVGGFAEIGSQATSQFVPSNERCNIMMQAYACGKP